MPSRLAGSMLLLGVLASSAAAQAVQPQETLIGPIGGINFAEFGGDDVNSADTRTGFQAGVFASFPLGSVFALMPGVAFSQEGTSFDGGGGVTVTFKLDYLEFPLALKASAPLAGSGRLRPYLLAGPSLGVKVSCKLKASSGSQSAEADCDDPTLGFDTKTIQFSALFGAGLEIGRVTVGARYQLGLSSIDDSGADADVKNRVLSIVAGYGFRLGH